MQNTLKTMTAEADALKAQGRLNDAIAVHHRIVAAFPENAIAAHNLAATLGDAGFHGESAEQARNALRLGSKAAETHLVLARALMNNAELDAALEVYDTTCSINPQMVNAQYERCQLIWMMTNDRSAALDPLEREIKSAPGAKGLLFVRARVLQYTGDMDRACDQMEALVAGAPRDVGLLCQAAHLLNLGGRTDPALAAASAALNLAPDYFPALDAWASVCLAAGDPDNAQDAVYRLLSMAPENQQAINLQAMVWRMRGDKRFEALYDYNAFVLPQRIEAPEGWADRDAYLADLSAELKTAHPYRTHPFGQSVRLGSQRSDILSVGTPAIQAFRGALGPLVDAYIERLGDGDDPLRRRRSANWRIHGIWSVHLTPGGYHTDHVHPSGWLSSAFYVELPEAVRAGGKEGWIRFGHAGIPARPAQEAQHWVQPEPGTLVLFPSYMWHGTVPFGGDQPRLTIAMDFVPD